MLLILPSAYKPSGDFLLQPLDVIFLVNFQKIHLTQRWKPGYWPDNVSSNHHHGFLYCKASCVADKMLLCRYFRKTTKSPCETNRAVMDLDNLACCYYTWVLFQKIPNHLHQINRFEWDCIMWRLCNNMLPAFNSKLQIASTWPNG